MLPDDLAKYLETQLELAQSDYLDLSQGKSVCEIGKFRLESPTLKQAEGRLAALRDCQRLLRQTSHTPQHLAKRLQALRDTWATSPEPGPLWVHYKNSGVRAIDELIGALQTNGI